MMRQDLELVRVLQPGEEGTQELVEKYGEALVCVRLWYDAKDDVELKTAELVAVRRPWQLRRRQGGTQDPRSPRRED